MPEKESFEDLKIYTGKINCARMVLMLYKPYSTYYNFKYLKTLLLHPDQEKCDFAESRFYRQARRCGNVIALVDWIVLSMPLPQRMFANSSTFGSRRWNLSALRWIARSPSISKSRFHVSNASLTTEIMVSSVSIILSSFSASSFALSMVPKCLKIWPGGIDFVPFFYFLNSFASTERSNVFRELYKNFWSRSELALEIPTKLCDFENMKCNDFKEFP